MTIADYALILEAEEIPVVMFNGVHWRKVRPFFHRPVLPLTEIPVGVMSGPRRTKFGGFQFAVQKNAPRNSMMHCLVFTDSQSYSLDTLNAKRRREVRDAQTKFSVRAIQPTTQLAESAHRIFVSFHVRTGYRPLPNRLDPTQFATWVNGLLAAPDTMVIGAFSAAELVALNVSRVVDNTLVYSSYFARWEAMKHHVSSLMLHTVRTAATELPGVDRVFAGMRKQGPAQSVDAFYLHRGCTILSLPSQLHLSPTVAFCLRHFTPHLYRRLRGV
jgi:hypothetical protein